jgi:structural maintenance of chromosome 4
LIDVARQPFDAPESVPRLYDLIRVKDERVKPAFYSGLRNTLVAENLEQATRIGYGSRTRHRIVTLKGRPLSRCFCSSSLNDQKCVFSVV